MSAAALSGAIVGLGLWIVLRIVVPPVPRLAVAIARLDAAEPHARAAARSPSNDRVREVHGWLARWLDEKWGAAGWRVPRLGRDLALLDRTAGSHLATKVLVAAAALLWVPMLGVALRLLGIGVPLAAPIGLGIAAAVAASFLPDLALHTAAGRRRRAFRHVVGCFLDLVAMNLAGGRGLPEALLSASGVSEHWALQRIRDALDGARLAGCTPWEALGRLGDAVGVDELCDLAGALALAADDGAKIRLSLTARAASIRRKELSDVEGTAGERSQSMLVAQLLLCTAFLLFLVFPATYSILTST